MHRLFLYGEVGSGKSTLCSSICLYFMEQKGYSLRVNFNNLQGTRYLYQWIDNLRERKFPGKTSDDTFLNIDIGLENLITSEQIGITFFEASGEQTVKIVPIDARHSQLDERLESWLLDTELILIVISSNSTASARNRMHQFLSYLIHVEKTNVPIGLVISKWDLVASGSAPGQKISPSEYSAMHFPESLRLLKSSCFTGGVEVFDFSVGSVQTTSASETEIVELDFNRGANDLAEWIIQMRRQRE